MSEQQTAAEMVTLVREYHADVYRYAYRLCGSQEDAEDITQDVFLRAQQHLSQLRSEATARRWLLAITRNCFLRSVGRKRPAAMDAGTLEEFVPSPEQDHACWDTLDLQHALDELPAEHRVVLLMFYFEFRSYKDIARELGIPVGTVMSRLSRAKSQLRSRLTTEAEMPADAIVAVPRGEQAVPGRKSP